MSELYDRIVKEAEADFLRAKRDLVDAIKDCLKYKKDVDDLIERYLSNDGKDVADVSVINVDLRASVDKMQEVFIKYTRAKYVLFNVRGSLFRRLVEAQSSSNLEYQEACRVEFLNSQYTSTLNDIETVMGLMEEYLEEFEGEGAVIASLPQHRATDFVDKMDVSMLDLKNDIESADNVIYHMKVARLISFVNNQEWLNDQI